MMGKRLAHNWNLKLMALVLAVALWSHVRGEINPIETGVFRVALKAHPPRDLLITNGHPPLWVQVTLRAPRQTLSELRGLSTSPGAALPNPLVPAVPVTLRGGEVRAWLDFAPGTGGQAQLGATTLPIRANCSLPDARVIGTEPGSVSLQLDRASHIPHAVRPRLSESPDFTAQVRDLSPRQVTLYGPSEKLERVAQVLAPLRTPQDSGDDSYSVALRPVDERGRTVQDVVIEPKFARARVTISERVVNKTLRVVVHPQGRPAPDFRLGTIQASPSRVRVRGPRRTLQELSALDLTLDVSDARSDLRRRVRLTLPPGVQPAQGEDSPRFITLKAVLEAIPTGNHPAPDARRTEHLPTHTAEPPSADTGASLAPPTRREPTPAPSHQALPPPAAE